MICKSCGTTNSDGSKFCIKCGAPLNQETEVVNNTSNNIQAAQVSQTTSMPNVANNMQTNTQVQGNTNNTTVLNNTSNTNMTFIDNFILIYNAILRPSTTFKKYSSRLESTKNSLILSLINVVVCMIITIITTIFTTATTYRGELDFSELKEIKWPSFITGIVIGYFLVLAIIAGVNYFASLVLKKDTKFPKLLGIASVGMFPLIIFELILCPLLFKLNVYLGSIVGLVGIIYSFVIIYEAYNDEFKIDGDKKYYFNLICVAVVIILIILVYEKLLNGGIASYSSSSFSYGDLMDFFD